ncbi:MAG: GNAT family N-acetyltransferase [Kangiellaceae bacterium]|nr:GNAT family N-acetyltransferase [Kangiellaceae bacterium]
MEDNNSNLILQASKDHIDDASVLFNAYRQFYKMPADLEAARKFLTTRINNKDSLIFVSYRAKAPVGFVQIYPAFSSVAMRATWILNDLYVDINFRKQGVAKQMMQFVQQLAKDRSIFSIKLVTATSNKQAKALYESIGYKKLSAYDSYSKVIR